MIKYFIIFSSLIVVFTLSAQESVELKIGGIGSQLRVVNIGNNIEEGTWNGAGASIGIGINYKLNKRLYLYTGIGWDFINFNKTGKYLDTTFGINDSFTVAKKKFDFVNLDLKTRIFLGHWKIDLGYQLKYNILFSGSSFLDIQLFNGFGIERNIDVVNRFQHRLVTGISRDFKNINIGINANIPLNDYFSTRKYNTIPEKSSRFYYLELEVRYILK